MKVGMLTGGGDCPGLNAVIRAVVRKGVFHYHDEFVGFMEGWRGLIEDKSMPLDLNAVGGILPRGGTILTNDEELAKKLDGVNAEAFVKTIAEFAQKKVLIVGGGDSAVADQSFETARRDRALPRHHRQE